MLDMGFYTRSKTDCLRFAPGRRWKLYDQREHSLVHASVALVKLYVGTAEFTAIICLLAEL